jgi:hypothetical protein
MEIHFWLGLNRDVTELRLLPLWLHTCCYIHSLLLTATDVVWVQWAHMFPELFPVCPWAARGSHRPSSVADWRFQTRCFIWACNLAAPLLWSIYITDNAWTWLADCRMGCQGKATRHIRRLSTTFPQCSPQIPHDLLEPGTPGWESRYLLPDYVWHGL